MVSMVWRFPTDMPSTRCFSLFSPVDSCPRCTGWMVRPQSGWGFSPMAGVGWSDFPNSVSRQLGSGGGIVEVGARAPSGELA